MSDFPYHSALIVGAGAGISASLARKLSALGMKVGLAARDVDKLAALVAETGAAVFAADAARADSVAALFAEATQRIGEPDVVVYNASARAPGPLAELDPAAVERALGITAFGAFLVAQQAARLMVPRGRGAILLTGATAGVKGFANSAAFAMGKFALRGLAQSAARELGPKGVHVAHFVIDGGVRAAHRPESADRPDSLLDPDAIAQTYVDVLRQPRTAWSLEVELRPWVERF
jgi:NAD(P)-dependent dehydrogenase (short-subunit alcohol dehydrogenase family)